jgi:protein-L-isoaspartate O-methyltransferase
VNINSLHIPVAIAMLSHVGQVNAMLIRRLTQWASSLRYYIEARLIAARELLTARISDTPTADIDALTRRLRERSIHHPSLNAETRWQPVLQHGKEDMLVTTDVTRMWAFLLDQLAIVAGERVLHLGCGTGYCTAILAELVGPTGKITAIEIDASLAEKARPCLWTRQTAM